MATGNERDWVDVLLTLATPTAVACLGWWLRGQFSDVKEHAENELTKHELVDQSRHKENVQALTDINMHLARMDRGDNEAPRGRDNWRR